MNYAPLIVVICLVPLAAAGQVRKCVDASGKTVYSDVVCMDTTARETHVNTNANTVDHSGLRKEAQRSRDAEELVGLTANAPRECRFKFYAYGDPKGKALSEKAKAECIRNIVAAKQGKPTSKDDYAMWKDHFDQTSRQRIADVQQINANQNARDIAASNEAAVQALGRKLDRPLTCTRDPLSIPPSLTCK